MIVETKIVDGKKITYAKLTASEIERMLARRKLREERRAKIASHLPDDR